MRFIADLHLHSRFARATSRDLNPSNLHKWSALKGIGVVGTGDFTHPEWFDELGEQLEEDGDGLYRLKAPWREAVEAELPPACNRPVRFMLTVEISSIYKKNGRTRKVHNIVMLPSLGAVSRFNRRLGAIGNLKSDGRPILGLDSRDLLEICLEVCPDVLFVPAHIWTPHFAALGSASGFDSLEECYGDLLPHIFAVETGLSSDPPMNWRLSMLEPYAIISNSDAHSPQKLGREATCFDAEMSYPAIYDALKTRDARFEGTLEFYPEEGKYHWDGHRKCGVCWKPDQTLQAQGLCPVCGRTLTVGVLHRVELLADRPEGFEPASAKPFEYLVPLPEIIGAAVGVGPNSKKVQGIYRRLLEELGPELEILRYRDPEAIAALGESLVAEGVRRMRRGQIDIAPGHDGEYGKVRVFSDEERRRLAGQALLFDLAPDKAAAPLGTAASKAPAAPTDPTAESAADGASADVLDRDALDEDQRQAVEAEGGPVVVVAGPGAGKTRTLISRIAYLIGPRGVSPARIAAVTFTRRAAAELRQRLGAELGGTSGLAALRVGTFHRLALELTDLLGGGPRPALLEAPRARALLEAALHERGLELDTGRALAAISLAKAAALGPEQVEDAETASAYAAYQEALATAGACDYDDILLDFLRLLENDAAALEALRQRLPYLLVDEFQDVNAVQYRLVRLWAGEGAGLFAIGDPDQAIYAFRGADAAYFTRLRQDFAGAKVCHLGRNYRSAGAVVEAAAGLIAHNQGREALALRPMRPTGERPRLLEVSGEKAEGIAVAEEIARQVGGADMQQADRHPRPEGPARSFADFAVLFRTGRQAEAVEECLAQAGLPYRVVGREDFLEAASVRAALAFCRLLQAPSEPRRQLGLLEEAGFGLDPADQAKLRRAAELPADLPGPAQKRLREIEAAAPALVAAPPAAVLSFWRDYWATVDADFGRLEGMAAEYDSLDAFLEALSLGGPADRAYPGAGTQPRAEAVTLMTLHASKGLEFPVVFICGLEDGLLPLRRADSDIEEERRLFYVGLTRAREEALLLRARRRLLYGQRQEQAPSPFLGEIPEGLLGQGRQVVKAARQLSLF